MPLVPYTIITFSPVQGFIEKSRKLRDLFGSSFLISYLARSLCDLAEKEGLEVIAPATPKLTQGIPNQIIIKGHISREKAYTHLQDAWGTIVTTCRDVIERRIPRNDYNWKRAWDNWKNHCWEFFWAQSSPGGTITEARRNMNEVKRSRDWTGINWIGESSTLSGSDAIAWPGMLDRTHPKPSSRKQSAQALKIEIDAFYEELRQKWDGAFFDSTERLSIPELIKRLVTHPDVADLLNIKENEYPNVDLLKSFRDLNRHDESRWTGWFQGDGDRIGAYLRSKSGDETSPDAAKSEENALKPFTQAMIKWGEDYKLGFNQKGIGRIIYAGGDDFLGVLYCKDPEPPLTLQECLKKWLYQFPEEWAKHKQPITVSVGFVWAAPGVPQRDILQHCKQAEKSAKSKGRDRVAIRILFNGGNHLEWTCPWRFLQPILDSYRDREGNCIEPNWGHINEDAQALSARHAFKGKNSQIAQELFKIYFPDCAELESIVNSDYWFNPEEITFDSSESTLSGILGNEDTFANSQKLFNEWVISLARIGIHLSKKAPSLTTTAQ